MQIQIQPGEVSETLSQKLKKKKRKRAGDAVRVKTLGSIPNNSFPGDSGSWPLAPLLWLPSIEFHFNDLGASLSWGLPQIAALKSLCRW